MIKQANANERSRWKKMFHACRAAVRSPAGSVVAEFLLPLLVLDIMCFGTEEDEENIIQEMKDVLSFRPTLNSAQPTNIIMTTNEIQKSVNTLFTTIDTLQIWAEKETEERYKSNRGHTQNQKNSIQHGKSIDSLHSNESMYAIWPCEESVARINDLISSIPLSMCAKAAAGAGLDARALQYLESETREQMVELIYDNNDSNDHNIEAQSSNGPGKSLFPLQKNNLGLMQDLLGRLNDCDSMTAVARERERGGLSLNIIDLIHEKEVLGDWKAALQGYEQALQLYQQMTNHSKYPQTLQYSLDKLDLEKGMCRCLLQLGQLESVSNQVRGILAKNKIHFGLTDANQRARDELLPYACEASWRLGRWSQLEILINSNVISAEHRSLQDADGLYHIKLGQACLGLHRGDMSEVSLSIRDARIAVMTSLASVARESYPRFYPYLLRLHCLREIENSSEILCANFKEKGKQENSDSLFFDHVRSDSPTSWFWDGRLRMAAPEVAGASEIRNVRLALSRIAKEPSLEGNLWLKMGKSTRKAGLIDISRTAFAHAVVSYNASRNDLDGPVNAQPRSNSLFTQFQHEIQLQLAKLKHLAGESAAALQMMNMEYIDTEDLFDKDEKDAKKKILSWLYGDIVKWNEDIENDRELEGHMNSFGRRLLQSTEWIVEGRLKSGNEVKERYKLVQKVCPNWER